MIFKAKRRGDSRHPTGRSLHPLDETGNVFGNFSAAGGSGGASAGWLVQTITRLNRTNSLGQSMLRIAGFPDTLYFQGTSRSAFYLQHATTPSCREPIPAALDTASFNRPSDLATVSCSKSVMDENISSTLSAI